MKRDSKPENKMAALAATMAKKRWRLPQWAKDWAAVNGIPLRKRGRPRKAEK